MGPCQDEVGEFKALEKDCNSWDNRENGQRPRQMTARGQAVWRGFHSECCANAETELLSEELLALHVYRDHVLDGFFLVREKANNPSFTA